MKKKELSRIPTKKVSISILFVLMISGNAIWTLSGGNPKGGEVLVTKVVDGDTIYVGRGWRRTMVRLIGVDTPETLHPEKSVEFFGPEASEFTKRHLEGKRVQLKFESSNLHDHYGRLLAYVLLQDGTFFNAELIKQGYARVITPSPFRYYREFTLYQQKARLAGVGIWATKTGKIIGNKVSKIYHLPWQANYGRIMPENRVYFESEEDAIMAGYRSAKR